MRSSVFLLLFITIAYQPLIAQSEHDLDSMLHLYQTSPEDIEKVKLLNNICQNVLYTRPNEVYDYALEMISLSQKLDYQKGMAWGYYRIGGYFLNRHELDSAQYYHQMALDINSEIQDMRGILNANTELGIVNMRRNEFEKALEYFHTNIDLYNHRDTISYATENDFRYIGTTFQNISIIHTEKGRYNLALKVALETLKFYQELGEPLYIADGYNSLGTIEGQLENHENSIEYLQKAYETYHKYEDKVFEGLALNNIGLALVQLGRGEEALDYYYKAIAIAQENHFKKWEGNFLTNLGTALLELNRFGESLKYLNKSAEVLLKSEHPTEIRSTYLNLGRLYNLMDKPTLALQYLNQSIEISDSLNSLSSSSRAYYERSRANQKLGLYEQALEDFKVYSQLEDSIFNATKSQQIEELRIMHDLETKEKEIIIQQNEIALLLQTARVNNLQRTLLGGGLVFLLLVFGLGYYGMKQKVKRNKIEREKLDAELEFKKRELTTHALHLAKKNEVLEGLKMKAQELKIANQEASGYGQIISAINFDLNDDNNWDNFANYFEQVHKDFNSKAKQQFPSLTSNELRLMALLKMNLSSKEIANILNISHEGIKKARYRLRKKLDMSSEESLESFALQL